MYWSKRERESYEDDCACIIYFTTVNVYQEEGNSFCDVRKVEGIKRGENFEEKFEKLLKKTNFDLKKLK